MALWYFTDRQKALFFGSKDKS